MANDAYHDYLSGLQSPALHAAAITPNDSADLATASRAIFVGNGGNLKITMQGGETVTLNGVLAGTTLSLRISRVFATGTTCANLISLW
ncbi:MAG: hypothetical protein M3O15_09920 [Acidobacteriota bacterium]|nr:hypothetical protein [Acidobacteriota bacterium]